MMSFIENNNFQLFKIRTEGQQCTVYHTSTQEVYFIHKMRKNIVVMASLYSTAVMVKPGCVRGLVGGLVEMGGPRSGGNPLLLLLVTARAQWPWY